MRTVFLMIFCSAWGGVLHAAQEQVTVKLWTTTTPGANGSEEKDNPSLMAYIPDTEKANGTAVIICPGGGYAGHAMDHEGRQVAEWLCGKGVAAFILKYRLPADGYRHPIPLLDAQRAIRQVRFNAEKWHTRPDKVGILGFSAGGHLASTAGTHFDKPAVLESYIPDTVDAVSARPDFMILLYPVVSMTFKTHGGSRDNLLGRNPSQELLDLMSNEKQVTDQTPPVFLIHADDDNVVPVENSIRFYEALRDHKIPAEMHIYLKGGHGFGMRPNAGPASQWPAQCEQWMQQMNLLPADTGQ